MSNSIISREFHLHLHNDDDDGDDDSEGEYMMYGESQGSNAANHVGAAVNIQRVASQGNQVEVPDDQEVDGQRRNPVATTRALSGFGGGGLSHP